jgi:molybdate transport system substrate-binding protein
MQGGDLMMHKKISGALDRIITGFAAGLLLIAGSARAGEVKVAVAANFAEAAREIGALFAQSTGHKAVFSFASTGTLYTQITQDAPFEVFLAADQTHPEEAIDEGFAVAGSRFTYATGRIVLFSMDKSLVKGEVTLKDGDFTRIAIANPVTAPYGAAAVAALKKLGAYAAVEPRLVQGTNIAQTYQFVETGNAELGFVALSQVARRDDGSRWLVPEDLYPELAQDAVLLKRGADNPAARAFLDFLKGPEAANVKTKFGYGTGN